MDQSLETLSLQIGHQASVATVPVKIDTIKCAHLIPASELTKIKLIVAELSSNISKYARMGRITIDVFEEEKKFLFKIHSQDIGAGIVDISAALQEGFSSAKTLGLGLPAIKRMADEFTIESVPGRGTTIQVSKHIKRNKFDQVDLTTPGKRSITLKAPTAMTDKHLSFQYFSAVKPLTHQINSGDKVLIKEVNNYLFGIIIDVSGHGDAASQLADEMILFLEKHLKKDLRGLVNETHKHFHGSRGAALGIMMIDKVNGELKYCGVGNTKIIFTGDHAKKQAALSKNGVIGIRLPTLSLQTVHLNEGDCVTLISDGVKINGLASFLNSLRFREPQYICENIMAKYARQFDDSSCVVLKC